jgi:AraC-like DNA-binding protein
MSYIFISSLLFAFVAPLFWAVFFFLNMRKSMPVTYGFWLFLSASIVFLLCMANNARWIELSLFSYFFYPMAIMSMPVFLSFYEYSLAHNNKPVPPWFYLFLIVPAIQWFASDYIYYVHYSFEILKTNYYSMYHIPFRQLSDEFKPAGVSKLITLGVNVVEVCVLIVLVLSWVPAAINNSPQKKISNVYKLKRNFISLSALMLVVSIVGVIQITSEYISSSLLVTILEYLWGTISMVCGYFMYNEAVNQKAAVTDVPLMPDDLKSSFIKQMEQYFKVNKPYLNPDLKISDVARAMKTNRTYLSNHLSSELDTNFNRFVNKYRIEESLRILQNPGEKKLREIAELSGFNSYSVFFCAFKEETGSSPAGYQTMLNSIRNHTQSGNYKQTN